MGEMATIRVQADGEVLSVQEFDSAEVSPEFEFGEVIRFVVEHYPDTAGITVDMYGEDNVVVNSYTFA